MSKHPYEIELVRVEDDWFTPEKKRVKPLTYACDYELSEVATLTGIPKADIWELLSPRLRRGRWRGRDYIEVAELLDFSVSPRFVPFDPATPWPCLLRLRKTKKALAEERRLKREETGDPKATVQDYWYTNVFNQGDVFLVDTQPRYISQCSLDQWLKWNPDFRVTSMMSFYMSDKLVLTKKDF